MASNFGFTGAFNWRAAEWFAVAFPLGAYIGPKVLNAVSRLVADSLFQHAGGARASGRPFGTWRDWRALARRDARSELDVAALVADLAGLLDAALTPAFRVSGEGACLVASNATTTRRVEVHAGDIEIGRTAEETLVREVERSLEEIRSYVAVEGGVNWKPAATGSRARAMRVPGGLSVWFEQMGRPTALLGTVGLHRPEAMRRA